ncbi:hypothetical protein, partial [Pseudomonas putida]|uniref:hypothetical protein n=1 Tax=Pseudomonas putida TaxID=303 RepID=UPI0039E14757
DFFDFAVGAHHCGLAPERNRERSIGHQVEAWNVGMMDPLRSTYFKMQLHLQKILTAHTSDDSIKCVLYVPRTIAPGLDLTHQQIK